MSLTRYALLIAPSQNRVYGASATNLTIAELGVFNAAFFENALQQISATTLGSVDYVTFSAPLLDARAIALLSNLSSLFALFELEHEKLIPIELARADRFDSDLISIQKYSGKTNEHFTKLLLNVTLAASAFGSEFPGRKFRILDPLCGRGTTLNQALTYGFDAAGIELDKKDFEAYATFIQRYVKDKRLKHSAQLGHVKGERKLDLTFAPDKAAHKSGQTVSLSVVNADTARTVEVLPPRSFDLIVTDAPYGVQHASHGEERLARAPSELLERALPVWFEMLRPGGALGIAWNTRVLRREALAKLLTDPGFQVQTGAPYTGFEHAVDHAIVRDLMVATKAG
ncbi:MAG TPA: hypothetical protein VHV51_25835 [Polyangiaceae bacterium]|jgi:SAM-dependent methyltransferase|nr:hypothetical protein [Polyangiaceae bacterium]